MGQIDLIGFLMGVKVCSEYLKTDFYYHPGRDSLIEAMKQVARENLAEEILDFLMEE